MQDANAEKERMLRDLDYEREIINDLKTDAIHFNARMEKVREWGHRQNSLRSHFEKKFDEVTQERNRIGKLLEDSRKANTDIKNELRQTQVKL